MLSPKSVYLVQVEADRKVKFFLVASLQIDYGTSCSFNR